MNNFVCLGVALLIVSVSLGYAQPAFDQRPLEEVLNPDGTLKKGVQGSFEAVGYEMHTEKNGEPIFIPKTQNTTMGTWSALGSDSANGVNNLVYAIAVSGSDVYVGGNFTEANVGGTTVPVNYIARFNLNTNTWSALGSGINNGLNNVVYAIAVSGSDVYVGGEFTQANVGSTTVSVNRIARFNLNTNTWSALGSGSGNGVNNYVYAIKVSGSDVYVGGFFTQANVGGTTVPVNFIARFNTSTNTWNALASGSGNGVNYVVYAIAVSGSDVYVGGTFTQANVGGTTVTANKIARFNLNTNTWSALGSGSGNGVSSDVHAISASSSDVYVGGQFTHANTGGREVLVNRIARFNLNTNTWSSFGSGSIIGLNGDVRAIDVPGSDVYVGGYFSEAYFGGKTVTVNRVARWNSGTTSVEQIGDDLPTSHLLSQNYPNPFNSTTTISFSIPSSELVCIKVYNLQGEEIATLVHKYFPAGTHSCIFDATNLTSGVYLYKFQAGKYCKTLIMTLIK